MTTTNNTANIETSMTTKTYPSISSSGRYEGFDITAVDFIWAVRTAAGDVATYTTSMFTRSNEADAYLVTGANGRFDWADGLYRPHLNFDHQVCGDYTKLGEALAMTREFAEGFAAARG